VLEELEGLMPDYEKGADRIFTKLIDQLEVAINYSKRSFKAATDSHTDNPSTPIHKVIEYLRCINTKCKDGKPIK